MRKYLNFFLLLFCISLTSPSCFCSEALGFQIIGDLPEDCSLLKKLQTISDEERKILSPEFHCILMQLKERIKALINGEPIEEIILHEELTPEEALLIFGPCLEIDNYNSDPFVKAVFSKSFSPEFYFVRFSEKTIVEPEQYFTETELEEIYQTAKKILAATSYGDHLISLGQSPAYLVEALEELASTDVNSEHFRVIYKIPYSGAADFVFLNSHYKRLQLSNVVTTHSLSYYKQILSDKGVSPQKLGSETNIYVIDLIGTGGSIASFLKLLVSWYDSLNIPIPNFQLLDISVEDRNFKNETRIVLPLSDTCQIHIDRLFIHTTEHLSDVLDYTEGEDRIIPPFSPLLWKLEYEYICHQYPNPYGSRLIKCVRDYVRFKKF